MEHYGVPNDTSTMRDFNSLFGTALRRTSYVFFELFENWWGGNPRISNTGTLEINDSFYNKTVCGCGDCVSHIDNS